jgi:hypothetical protein
LYRSSGSDNWPSHEVRFQGRGTLRFYRILQNGCNFTHPCTE